MASLPAKIPSFLLPLLLLSPLSSTANSPELSPSPAPFSGDPSPPPFSLSPLPNPSPDLSPHYPLPPPLSSPFATPAAAPNSLTFSTPPFDLVDGEDQSELRSSVSEHEYGSGDGKKVSVAVGAAAGVAVVGVGALVWRRRRENVRRARYGYVTRRDLL